jgi:hypothetical protein
VSANRPGDPGPEPTKTSGGSSAASTPKPGLKRTPRRDAPPPALAERPGPKRRTTPRPADSPAKIDAAANGRGAKRPRRPAPGVNDPTGPISSPGAGPSTVRFATPAGATLARSGASAVTDAPATTTNPTAGGRPAGTRPKGQRPAGSRRPATAPAPTGRKGRRVHRVVRRIELWSVLKLAIVLFACLYVAVLASLAIIWNLAYTTGQIDRLQSFLSDVGLDNWRFYGDRMFKACMAIGAVGVLAGTMLAVLVTALVNVVSEITGGIRFVVIEEGVKAKR